MTNLPPGILNAAVESVIGVTRFVTSAGAKPAAVGDAGRGPEVSLLSLRGPSKFGRSVTLMVSAMRDFNSGVAGFAPGIMTGILHFGNGGGLAKLEFDIPCAETHDPTSAATDGIAFSVPAGNIHLLAREDSKIIPKAGMGNPSNNGGALVSAHATYGVQYAESILKKTHIWAWESLAVGATSERIPVGPFCQDFILIRYPRSGITATLGTVIKGGNTILETYTFLPGTDISAIPIPPRATWLEITNNGPFDIEHGQSVFNMPFFYAEDPNSTITAGGGPGLSGGGDSSDGSFGLFFGGGGAGAGANPDAACVSLFGTGNPTGPGPGTAEDFTDPR